MSGTNTMQAVQNCKVNNRNTESAVFHSREKANSEARRTTCRLLTNIYGYASHPGTTYVIFSLGPKTGCGCVNMTQIE